jgi:hypothetical protein
MKRSILFLLIFTLFLSKNVFTQILDYGKGVDNINMLSKSSVYIRTPQGSGSGILFNVPFSDTAKVGAVYLCTAQHVIDKRDSTGKIIGRFDTIKVYINLLKGGIESRRYSIIKSYFDLDIAILKPIDFFRSFSEYDVTTPSIGSIASFNELRKGQSTFLSGYPYNLGTTGKYLNPVTQSGIISYVDTSQSLVLIDIPVNHGNSGCPVYVTNDKGVIKLLGIVFEYQPSGQDFVFSNVYKKMVPVNTSLGRVVLIHSILADLYKLK